jgi:hypothetical protein
LQWGIIPNIRDTSKSPLRIGTFYKNIGVYRDSRQDILGRFQ